jgi:hypothetical protein
MTNPKLALIPSGYKATKVYSILPSDGGGDFTFDRANGYASRVRKDGLIEEVSNDTPRLDWLNSDCPSLLLEPQRLNRQVYSEQIDNAVWSKVSTTVTANQIVSPSGEYNADKVQRTSTSANYVTDSASKSASAELDITTSMFVKKGEGDFFAIRQQGAYPNRGEIKYQFSTNTITTSVAGSDFTVVGSSVEDYGNGWIRLSATFNTDAHSTVATLFSPRATDGTVDASDTSDSAYAYVWGVQVEEGSFSTSYIKTEGTTSRFAETCTNAGDATIFNDEEGVLYAEISTNFEGTGGVKAVSVQYDVNNYVAIYFRNDNNLSARVVGSGNVTQVDATYAINTFYKIAVSYNSTNVKFYVNGTQVDIDTTNTLPTSLNKLSFNRGSGFGTEMEGKCKDLRYYDTALTDAELTELTT